jgi:hypothetical protein
MRACALSEHVERTAGEVRDQTVDAHIEQFVHLDGIIDSPDVDLETE